MAGTVGSGGLGALSIGGIAAAAVVAGSVVAYLSGVFDPAEPVVPVVPVVADAASNQNAAPEPADAPATEVAPVDGDTEAAVTEEATVQADTAEEEAVQVETTQEAPAEEAEVNTGDQPAEPASQDPSAQETETAGASQDAAPVAEDTAPVVAADPVADVAQEGAPVAEAIEEAAAEDAVAEPAVDPAAEPVAELAEEAAAATTVAETAETAAETTTEAAQAAEPAEEAQADTAAGTETAAPTQEDVFVLVPPQLDTVRFETDGNGLIAGRAQAGVEVAVLLDGEVLDQFKVDAGGEFVAFVIAPPSENQRVLSLMASHEGMSVASEASFILGATQVRVAAAEPAVATTAEPVADEPAQDAAAATDVAQPPAPEGTDTETAAETTPSTTTEATDTAEVVAEVPPVQTTAPAAVAVLRADASGITLVQPGTAETADTVALDTLSYSDAGNVDIAGRATPDSILRVYVDNTTKGDLRTNADGSWSASLSDIEPGAYLLRVDEVTAQGIVLSRVETPFTREAPAALAEAVPEVDPQAPEPLLRAITVNKGDSLWAISRKAYGDGRLYVRLFDANRNEIKDPDLIYPGQVFALPE